MTYMLLSSGRVACDRNLLLARANVAELATRVMNRRLRAHGIRPMRELDDFGSFSYRFNVTHAIKRDDGNWARLRAYEHDDAFKVFLDGPSALEALRRVNEAITPKSKAQLERRKKERRVAAKRKRSRKVLPKPMPRKKRKTVETRTLLTLRRNKVAPQFRHSRNITWHEAVRAVGELFEVKATSLITTQERTDFRLRRALERNQLGFAACTKEGFTIRFDLVTNWRGDLTQLRISFTDDNKHPLYRQARACFKKLLMGRSKQREIARLSLRRVLESDARRIAA